MEIFFGLDHFTDSEVEGGLTDKHEGFEHIVRKTKWKKKYSKEIENWKNS